MTLPKKYLKVKTSLIPNAGKGLFTTVDIPKGSLIVAYEGRRCAWKEVEDDFDNPYIYHIDDENVIDASKDLRSFGRYANDAAGLTRVKGLGNNAEYYEEGLTVFIRAKKDIPAGSEIFVSYGSGYWKQTRENIKADKLAVKK
ncbi:MAG: SET domain-containing protein [Niabella sp.]